MRALSLSSALFLLVACNNAELCNDGLDNNGDGVSDCQDALCSENALCLNQPGSSCDNPLALAEGEVFSGSTFNNSNVTNSICGDPNSSGADVVFTFTPTADVFRYSFTTPDNNMTISVRTSLCEDALAEIECFGPITDFVTVTEPVTPGVQLFIIVGGLEPGDTGDFTLSFENAETVCGNGIIKVNEACDDGNALDGDGCTSACLIDTAPLCSEAPAAQAQNAGDTTKGTDAVFASCTGEGKELFFLLNPTSSTATLTLSPEAGADLGLYALSECGPFLLDQEIACEDVGFAGEPETLTLTNLTPGTPVAIVVDSFADGDEGSFTLTVQN
jgi:cysteine-rich repeat protein